MSVQLEICVETVASAIAAHKGGAHRVELCSSLVEGGVTPSIGLVMAVVQATPIPVHVLIRPRAGDFVFSEDEMKAMECDIIECAKAGAAGVVVGALTPSGDIDEPKLHRFLASAAHHSLPVTFHRAFDHTRDPMGALQTLWVHCIQCKSRQATLHRAFDHSRDPMGALQVSSLSAHSLTRLPSITCVARRSLQAIFHRAFDHTKDPIGALQVLISNGVTRLLMSGQRATAEEGVKLIERLVGEARGGHWADRGAGPYIEWSDEAADVRAARNSRGGHCADKEFGGGSKRKDPRHGWRECSKYCYAIRCITHPCIGTIAGTANREDTLESSLPVSSNKYAF
ncbi:unnamed protein product [Closterium sp. Naga37s-1]|nr:unnamed protein product [Closterium sp. Naga37s-1]